jgi:hypothetical protein
VGSFRGGWWWFDFLCDVEEEMSEQGFRGVPGIPDGWELVRIGVVVDGEYRLMIDQSVQAWKGPHPSNGWAVIVRKIEKPKRYWPFASAEEFKPHRDRWFEREGAVCKVAQYDKDGIWIAGTGFVSFSECCRSLKFDDGTPFGVEVTE